MAKTNITPKDYISVSETGVFRGDKPCNKYNNQNITKTDVQDSIKNFLYARNLIAKKNPKMKLLQVHILLSTTPGRYDDNFDPACNAGEPEPFEHGLFGWCRIVVEYMGKNVTSAWLFYHRHDHDDNLYSTTFPGIGHFFYFFNMPDSDLRYSLLYFIKKQWSFLKSGKQKPISQKLMRRYLQKQR